MIEKEYVKGTVQYKEKRKETLLTSVILIPFTVMFCLVALIMTTTMINFPGNSIFMFIPIGMLTIELIFAATFIIIRVVSLKSLLKNLDSYRMYNATVVSTNQETFMQYSGYHNYGYYRYNYTVIAFEILDDSGNPRVVKSRIRTVGSKIFYQENDRVRIAYSNQTKMVFFKENDEPTFEDEF